MGHDTCNATGCTNKIRAYGYCRSHLQAFKATGHPGAGDPRSLALGALRDIQLSAAPLMAAVTAAGGIKPLLATTGLDEVSRQRLESTIRRALDRGHILATDADTVATEVLGDHPRNVWGRTWDAASTFNAPHVDDVGDVLARVLGHTA